MLAKIVRQSEVYFIQVKNKRTKGAYAFISNQKLAKKYYKKDQYGDNVLHQFEILVLERPHSAGYSNTHVVHKGETHCNLIGTNGNISLVKELLECDYIPTIVKLIK